jgi:hypothetical protein
VCNLGLGKFRDNPKLLLAAIGYLHAAERLPIPAKMLHTVTCSECEARWKTANAKARRCEGCKEKYAREVQRRRLALRSKTCQGCGGPFVDETQANNRRYCSSECRDRRNR